AYPGAGAFFSVVLSAGSVKVTGLASVAAVRPTATATVADVTSANRRFIGMPFVTLPEREPSRPPCACTPEGSSAAPWPGPRRPDRAPAPSAHARRTAA